MTAKVSPVYHSQPRSNQSSTCSSSPQSCCACAAVLQWSWSSRCHSWSVGSASLVSDNCCGFNGTTSRTTERAAGHSCGPCASVMSRMLVCMRLFRQCDSPTGWNAVHCIYQYGVKLLVLQTLGCVMLFGGRLQKYYKRDNWWMVN